jgi:hypothetical protein
MFLYMSGSLIGDILNYLLKVLSGITVAAVVYMLLWCSLLFSEGLAVAYMVKALSTAGRSQVRVSMRSLHFFQFT